MTAAATLAETPAAPSQPPPIPQSEIRVPQSSPDPIATIPELKQLHDQFLQVEAGQVTAPFETDVAKLNANYLAALDRAIGDEKKAGRLPGVLALEEEKQRVVAASSRQPEEKRRQDATATNVVSLPEDDDQTPASLKKLRAIYRDSLGKLEVNKAANLRLLTGPLATSLQELESKLTKQDRIPAAKTVAEYRERLAQSTVPAPPGEAAAAAPGPLSSKLKIPRRDPALAEATRDKPFENSLGMKFVPVKGTDVLFCIHETRYRDYAAYAKANPSIATDWKNQRHRGFTITERPEDHPVVSVRWEDAQGFCQWLSEKEKKTYRLPTDREWSVAVGLGRKEKWHKGDLPVQVKGDPDEFPWGRQWPPPKGAGNYSDESCKAKAPDPSAHYIDHYDDGYPTTAPVMSFQPNDFGLHDISKNI